MLAVAGKLRPKLHVGAAVFVGNGTGAAFDASAVTRYHLIDGYVIAPQAVIGGAYQVLPTLALGATAGVINMPVHGRRDVYPVINGQDLSTVTRTQPGLVVCGHGWGPHL